jgi:glutathione S-transferase
MFYGLRPKADVVSSLTLRQQFRQHGVHDRVAQRPRIAAYLVSQRRIAFNQSGIFRRYPELDR